MDALSRLHATMARCTSAAEQCLASASAVNHSSYTDIPPPRMQQNASRTWHSRVATAAVQPAAWRQCLLPGGKPAVHWRHRRETDNRNSRGMRLGVGATLSPLAETAPPLRYRAVADNVTTATRISCLLTATDINDVRMVACYFSVCFIITAVCIIGSTARSSSCRRVHERRG